MKPRLLSVLAAGAILLSAASPAHAQSREQRQIMATLQILQEQAQQLALAVSGLQQNVDDAIKALNARIDEANNANRKAFADQKLLIDGIAGDVRVVRERSDDNNVRITALREELEALRTTVLALSVAPPVAAAPAIGPDGLPLATPPVTAPPPQVAPPAASTAGLSPQQMLDTAKADYFAGQWSSAINGFEAFLRAFPRSQSAGEAQFFIGESYSAQSKWREAVAAYSLVMQTYPGAASVPDAYYKQGLAYERLGQGEQARASWEMVVKAFPDSDAGRLAKQNLDRVGARRP